MDSLIGKVPDDWAERPLWQVCDITAGPSPDQITLLDGNAQGTPIVTPKDLRHNRLADRCSQVASETAQDLSRYRLRSGDVVCVRTGQLGRQGLVEPDQDGWLIGAACLRLRSDGVVRGSYLVHYLGHPAVREWIVRNAGGAVIPTLSAKMVGALPVVVPPEADQVRIADVLGALDVKAIAHERVVGVTTALRDALLLQLLPRHP